MQEDSKNKIKGFRFLQSSMSLFMRFLQVVVYWKGAGGPERREYFIYKLFNAINNQGYNYECFGRCSAKNAYHKIWHIVNKHNHKIADQ